MNKVLYYFRGLETLFFFSLVVLTIFITVVLQLVCLIFTFPALFFDKYILHKFGNRIIYTFVNYVAFFINPHWSCELLTDVPRRDPKRRRIYMFNHLSLADVFVTTFLGKYVYLTSLYKDSLHKIYPRFFIQLIGHVPIYFEYNKEKGTKVVKKECVVGVMERCKHLVENGFDLCVFPEGTRSKTGKLQEFRDGFFRFALDHGYEIVPCGIHNTNNGLNSHTFITKSKFYLAIGTPISPKGRNLQELKHEVRKAMYSMIKMSPIFDHVKETVEELE